MSRTTPIMADTVIRCRLGGTEFAGLDEFDPPKPKGMRWRTYDRLIAKSRRLEGIADERIFSLINQMMQRRKPTDFDIVDDHPSPAESKSGTCKQ